ncbi:MAG: hypothetical protein KKB51_13520 [Candidatus Riflebacteria bacterium]|nr:hypothetical protein [Candidatus Riflebacteria bacterium]
MAEIRCEQCSATITVPVGYNQPFLKCTKCGAHLRTPEAEDEPTYRLLNATARERGRQQTIDLNKLSEQSFQDKSDTPKGQKITTPALASAETKATAAKQVAGRQKVIKGPIDERKILEDALGSNGMDMLMQLTASYMGELNENARAHAKSKAIQALMRSKVPAELAGIALSYAEKSDEIETILLENYKSNMFRGLGIFAIGLVISVLVHALAHPGWEFVLFQIPFAVGFAYAVNAIINMAGLKIPALRNEKVHYGFIVLAVFMILAYAVVGIWL